MLGRVYESGESEWICNVQSAETRVMNIFRYRAAQRIRIAADMAVAVPGGVIEIASWESHESSENIIK